MAVSNHDRTVITLRTVLMTIVVDPMIYIADYNLGIAKTYPQHVHPYQRGLTCIKSSRVQWDQ